MDYITLYIIVSNVLDMRKASESKDFIRTGFLASAMSFNYFARAFPFNGVGYCWPWALSSFERPL